MTVDITATIIVQLLRVVIPRFEALKKEGQQGQAKMTQYTRYLTLALALLQSSGIVALADREQLLGQGVPVLAEDRNFFTLIVLVITMTSGAVLVMWMGELITEKGIGNGMSLLIFAGIATRIPADEAVKIGIAQSPEGRQVLARQSVQDNLELGAYTRRDAAGVRQDLARMYARFPRLGERRHQLAGVRHRRLEGDFSDLPALTVARRSRKCGHQPVEKRNHRVVPRQRVAHLRQQIQRVGHINDLVSFDKPDAALVKTANLHPGFPDP